MTDRSGGSGSGEHGSAGDVSDGSRDGSGRETTVDALRRASRLARLLAAREWELEESRRAREEERGRWYYVLRIGDDVERSLTPVLMVMDEGPRAVAGALFQDHLATTEEVVLSVDPASEQAKQEGTEDGPLLVVRAVEGSRFLVGPATWPREVPMATAQVWHALGSHARARVLYVAGRDAQGG